MIAATMFSGIGAPECAAPNWNWIWHAEIEPFPASVLRARHPRSVNLGDVNAEDFVARAEAIGRPDVIVFGSPCQDFSVAGRRVGMDGARGNLALVALALDIRKIAYLPAIAVRQGFMMPITGHRRSPRTFESYTFRSCIGDVS